MVGLDPLTMLTIGIGVTMAMGVLLVAYSFEGAAGRRFQRRLARVKGGAGAARAGDKITRRSISRTDGKSTGFETLIKQYLPRRELLEERLGKTGRQITVAKYVVVSGVVALVTMLAVTVLGGFQIVPSLLFGLAVGVGVPHWIVGKMGKRRVAAFIHLFPEAIDLMVRALRSGLPISEAMINAGRESTDPVGVELRTIESGLQLGRDLDSLLWDIAKRIDAPEYRFFVIALSVQRETGGNLAETLANLSDVLRRRRTMRSKARAMASEARASTMILGSLPVVVTGILFFVSPGYIMLLFVDVRGLMLVGLALGMLFTGIGIMVKMARFEI
ncbi:MAG TPA: type II secretion system F family protein [Stellaceae bacterium]|jgi:tight adherence protein B|nr:type II secretion system F family protein [Stellaceae bacterium]